MVAPPAFSVDRNLGKLARWLRLMGFDTRWSPDRTDEAFLREAASGRVLVFRSAAMEKRLSGAHAVRITRDRPEDQLARVIRAVGITREDVALFTRCASCNLPVREAGREEVAGLVPEYVLAQNERFSRCDGCGRVFWAGDHTGRAAARLDRIFLLAGTDAGSSGREDRKE